MEGVGVEVLLGHHVAERGERGVRVGVAVVAPVRCGVDQRVCFVSYSFVAEACLFAERVIHALFDGFVVGEELSGSHRRGDVARVCVATRVWLELLGEGSIVESGDRCAFGEEVEDGCDGEGCLVVCCDCFDGFLGECGRCVEGLVGEFVRSICRGRGDGDRPCLVASDGEVCVGCGEGLVGVWAALECFDDGGECVDALVDLNVSCGGDLVVGDLVEDEEE